MIARALLAWLSILVLAVINGGVRQGFLIPRLGEKAGHIVSTLLLCLLVLAASWFLVPWVEPSGAGDTWVIGVLWVTLTLAFEFLAGHYVFGNTWARLLADYDLRSGRIWILVLVVTLFAPMIVWGVRDGSPPGA